MSRPTQQNQQANAKTSVAADRFASLQAEGDITAMALSPDQLRNKTFPIVKRGYDRPDVHRYLATIAEELESFNKWVETEDEIVVADVIEDEVHHADVASSEMAATAIDGPKIDEPAMTAAVPSPSDDFDRVGNEISLMLRQAQESSIKIRNDAEVEARTLVDQVRLDIEADRLAHEQAAGELITRTEERANEVRDEAESYSQKTRSGADEYATERRETAEREASESAAAAEADRKLASDKLAAATSEAESTVAEAKRRSEEIIAKAEADAKARSDQMLGEARDTLATLIDAERSSRDNLEEARTNIQNALEQLRLTELDDSSITTARL